MPLIVVGVLVGAVYTLYALVALFASWLDEQALNRHLEKTQPKVVEDLKRLGWW